ncbi:MAG TPA: hypothetical protein VIG80_04065 [Bacillaceae bacterium]
MMYKLLLYIHIASTIASIGPFLVLLPLIKYMRSAQKDGEQAYLGLFKASIRIVKHAGHVLVTSGVLLIIAGKWSWAAPWLVLTYIVMFGSIFFLARAFTPTLKKFADSAADRGMLTGKLHRAVWMYMALLMLLLWFMVAKPVLW